MKDLPNKIRQNLNSWQRITILVLGILAVLGVGFVVWAAMNQPTPKTVSSVAVQYPAGWQEVPLDEEDHKAGVIFRLNKTKPQVGMFARVANSKLEGNFDINAASDQIVSQFQQELTDFELLDKKVERIGDYDAVSIHYKHKDQRTKLPTENLMVVVPTPNQTFYMVYSAKKDLLPKLEEDIQAINTSLVNDFSTQLK